jgi:hypothetical protein
VKLRIVEIPEMRGYYRDPEEIGAMWREPMHDQDGIECWAIVLPNCSVFRTTDSVASGERWTVTGTAPDLTVTPSIDDRGPRPWHGWITNGELVG